MAPFDLDIFSTSQPLWEPVEEFSNNLVMDVIQRFNLPALSKISQVEKSGSHEINTRNYRVTFSSGQFLLKCWPAHSKKKDIEKSLNLLLMLNGVPLAKPIKSNNNSIVIECHSHLWSLYPFIVGEYFDGSGIQLEETAKVVTRLHHALSEVPIDVIADPLIDYRLSNYFDLFKKIKSIEKSWNEIFGVRSASILYDYWPYLVDTLNIIYSRKIDFGPIQPSHIDLHPHNILMRGGDVAAIIDFESCKNIPVGYAIAYAGLKLARQAVANSAGTLAPQLAGAIYLEAAFKNANFSYINLQKSISVFSATEVIRRIGIIFRLNLYDSDKKWNHVLPIQLGHLKEIPLLFGKI